MKFWVLIDLSNGDENSRRYLWWFASKKKAKEHRKHQMSVYGNATLSKPIKVRASKKMKEYIYER